MKGACDLGLVAGFSGNLTFPSIRDMIVTIYARWTEKSDNVQKFTMKIKVFIH